MDWVTGLKRFRFQELNSIRVKVKPSPFRALAWKLLGYYLLAMMAIGSISNFLIYQFFARSLYQKYDQELATLADAASHSLVSILQDPNHVQSPVHRPLDGDHDLDLSWQVLQQPEQGIEWFDVRGDLLAATGYPFPFVPLDLQGVTVLSSPQDLISLRRLTLPVYETTSVDSPLLGYVRVTESTEYVYQTLRQLQRGFIWGELCALTLTAIAGLGLIHQVLKPIKRSYAQLQQFTGDASHELRTPLAVIKTSVEVLQTHRQNFAKEDQNKLAHILSATDQMGNLVNDLLLLARQDGERKGESFILIPLDEILEDVLPWMELAAEKKQLSLKSDLASGIYIKGNPDLLKRVFINL